MKLTSLFLSAALVLLSLPTSSTAQTATVLVNNYLTISDTGTTGRPVRYVLAGDVNYNGVQPSSSGLPYITVNQPTTNVAPAIFDCGGHQLSSSTGATLFNLSGSNGFQITNCVINGVPNTGKNLISIVGAQAPVLWDNSLTNMQVYLKQSPNAIITNNRGQYLSFWIWQSNSVTATYNSFSVPSISATFIGFGFDVDDSNNNYLAYNTITDTNLGDDAIDVEADPGVIETGTTIQNNTFSGLPDCAVEIAGHVTNLTVTGNVNTFYPNGNGNSWVNPVVGAFFCGYHGTNLENSVVSNNTSTPLNQSNGYGKYLFYFYYDMEGGIFPTPNQPGVILFRNNTFANNSAGQVSIDFAAANVSGVPVLGPTDVVNNVFTDNTFTPVDLKPSTGFVDGGGNHCSSTVPPITCH